MIELCCEYLSVRCFSMYVFIMSRRRYRANPPSIALSLGHLAQSFCQTQLIHFPKYLAKHSSITAQANTNYLASLAKWLSARL